MDGSKQTKLEKYQNNTVIRNPENKNIKQNAISSNKSLEVKGNFNKIPDRNIFPSVNYNPAKQNKSLKNSEQNLLYRTTRIYTSLNKEYSNRDYNTIQIHRQDDSTSFEDSINKNSSKNRYSEMNSQSIDNKKNKIIRKNNAVNVNAEENRYPSNYSYYESKYSKKKLTEPEDNDKNTITTSINNSINFGYSKSISFHANESNNNTLNRSHMIPKKNNIINQNMNISPTKNRIIESNYYKIQKDKISASSNSESSKKGTVIFSNYNANNYKNNTISSSNTHLKVSNVQSNNSISIYDRKFSSPIKKEEINLYNTNEVIKNNKSNAERDPSSKSLEKANIKMLFNQQKKNSMKIKKKVEISEGNQSTVNYTKPFKLGMDNSDRSPKDSKNKNFSKINTNPNLNNHNATINNNKNINNNNNHNNNNNNNHTVNNSNKKNANMNYNNKGNIINKSSVNNHEVNKTNNKSSTLSNNNSAISNNKVNKNNCTINNSNNNTIKTNTKITENKKIVRNINFNTSSKSNLQENIKNISHELKPQPKTQAKEDKDKDKEKEKIVSNEKKQKKSMIQGIKILDLKNNSSIKDSENVSRELPKNKIIDISENNSSRKWPIQKTNSKIIEEDNDYFKEVANIMYENNTEPRTQIKNNIKENNDKDKDKNIKFTKGRSGQINEAKIERRFGIQNSNDNKEKVNTNENNAIKGVNNIKPNDNNYNTIATSKGAIIKNRRYSSDIILINSLKAFNELKRNSSNSKMNNDNKNNILNSHVKMNSSKNHSNFNLEFSEDKNKQKLQNQSKVSKYESISKRVIDIPKIENKEEKNDDEWDNEQYMGMRKKTYDVGLRLVKKSRFLNKAKKDNSLNNEFSSQTYVKSSDGISIAGKNEYGLKKINQDTYLIERNINGILNFNIYGVLDGHGEDGHFASQFVSRYILHRIKTHPSLRKEDEPKQIYYKLKENGYEIIANIFVDADVQIQKEKFNVSRSGTTCVIVIQLEEHIICANTGDSRAIIVFDENRDDNLMNSKIYPLSYDCKPELPNELARIIAYGGCVERAYDVENAECGPFRVWAKDKDYPGLAMSRSIGDIDAKKIGVIPNPQIVEYTIDHSSKYLILASDGIWEFIDSEDAMKYSNKYYIRNDPIGLCHDLSKRATALWEKNDCIIDDITVLVVFF